MEDFKQKLQKAFTHLAESLSQIRTSGANVSLIENIKVEAYAGSAPLTLRELGTISIVDSGMLALELWDSSIIDTVAKAIREAKGGLSPIVDGKTLRIPVPKLTEERRKEFTKYVGELVEEAKISVRNIRQDALSALEEQKDNSVISEDEYFRTKKIFEEEVKEINEKIVLKGKEKETEIMQI